MSGLLTLGVILAIIALFDVLVAVFGADSRTGFGAGSSELNEPPAALRWSNALR